MLLKRDYRIDDYQINTHESLADAKNDRLHVDERRYASLLKLTAGGTLVMGIWSMLKILMNTFTIPVSGAASFAVLFAIVIFLRYTVWTGASKEANDGKRRTDYIACTLILLAYGVFTVIRLIRDLISRAVTGQDISGFIFDLTSMILLCEVLHSAFRLRKVREGTAEVL